MVAGVCAGLAERYGLDLTLVRILTVVAAVVSGVGVAAYIAAWLLTPSTDAPAPLHSDSAVVRRMSARAGGVARRLPAILLVLLIVIAGTALVHSAWIGIPFGLVGLVVVLALLVGSRAGRWVLGSIALVLVLAIAAVGVAGPHLGSRSFRVTSPTALQTDYDYAAGTVTLDLSALTSLPRAPETHIRMGRGDVTVIAPANVPTIVHAETGLGSVTIDGHEVSGVGAAQSQSLDGTESAAEPLVLDIQVGAGSIDVRRS